MTTLTVPQEYKKDFEGMVETYLHLGYPKDDAEKIALDWVDYQIYYA